MQLVERDLRFCLFSNLIFAAHFQYKFNIKMKKFIKKLHLYFALILCLPLVLQGLSGAILVFEHEISDLILSHKTKIIEADNLIESPLASKIISVAQKEIPTQTFDGFSPSLIKIGETTTVRFIKKTEEKTSFIDVKLDPLSLETLQVKNPKEGFFAVIKKFHTNILIDGDIGHNIVGTWGLVMIFMIITGIILWWPKKDRPYTFTFKFRSEGKKFHRDIHVAIGFWTLAFFLVSSFGGVYLAFPKATSKVILGIFPGQDLPSISNEIKVNPTKNFIGIDEAIKLAKTTVTDEEKFISANLPTTPNQPFRINFAPKNYRYGEPAITVFIDQYQKKIIEKRDPTLYSTGEKIAAWQHAIHTGEAFNIAWKIIIFFVGFLPLLFSITGIMMWAYKKKFVQQKIN